MVKGYNAGKVVAEYALKTPGPLTDAQLIVDKNSLNTTGKETIHLDILLTDEKGNRVANQDQEATVLVEGPAKLIGLESGNLSDTDSYKTDSKKTYLGQLRGYIQTTGQKGDIIIKVKPKTLPEKKILIKGNTNTGK